jgi:murein tripeptide amidase MpaA
MTKITVSDRFDGGNIQMGDQTGEEGEYTVLLQIKPDEYTVLERRSHAQYFCFRSTVSDLEPDSATTVTYVIDNADKVSYPKAWKGSTVFYTTNVVDADSWKRKTDTTYDKNGNLVWTHTHERNGSIYFSYFPPYSYERHLDLVAQCGGYANVQSLGQTLDGREMDCIQAGSGDRVCWIIHRQHPGEPMAEFYAEGLLTRLLGLDSNGEVDGLVQKVLSLYTFYIVPSMCPDGAVRGHLRTNGVGSNLNREWADSRDQLGADYKAPTLERSPEVYHVKTKMEETGCDIFLDIHGDEELPFNFLSGAEGTVHWGGSRLESLHGVLCAAYSRTNPDMQIPVGYDPSPAGSALKNIATNAVADRFNCLAVTLEMPFKDCLSNPNPERGWSPNRARMLGASVLEPLAYVHPYLRAETDDWIGRLPAEDAYVAPSSQYNANDY